MKRRATRSRRPVAQAPRRPAKLHDRVAPAPLTGWDAWYERERELPPQHNLGY